MALRLTSMLLAGLRLGASASVLALAATSVHAQEVTGTIRGEVQDDAGNPLSGATVTITHAPSGTRSVQTTNASGSFSAPNLRVGGPYDLSVEAEGFEQAKTTISTLAAGQPQRISVMLVPAGQTIEVTASRRSSVTLSSGPATILSADDIAGVASVNRDVRQLAARDPMVSLDPTNGTGAISIAGQNSRFNRITVDGIAFGDPFGLEAGGLASSRGPVPLDAIGEFSVEVAPADIQQGNFQGGAVNSVLKSGGNEYNFSGFYSYTSDKLGGKRTRDIRVNRDYKSAIWGVQATGPIIKDKLFFAVTYEQMKNETPSDVGPAGENFANTLSAVTRADVTKVQEIANRVYGYDPLDVAKSVDETDKKLAVKLDWNISDNHRAAFTYIYAKGDLLAGQTSSNQVGAPNPTLSLQSNNYSQGSINHYWVGQVNSDWSSNFSTQVRVSYNDYKRLQVPYNGREFGQFQVCLADNPTVGASNPPCPRNEGRIQFGPDVSRQANELLVTTLGTEFQARYRQDSHDVKLIVERRQQDYNNLFAQNVSGDWRFDSLADLEARRANYLRISTPVSGDINDVAAIFKTTTWTFGAQDVWDATPDLSLQFGARYDLYQMGDRPAFNQAFTDRYGFTNTSTLNGRGVFQPRFGANWRPADRLTARMSAGLFAGGSPNVWLSNSFSNPGPLLATSTIQRIADGTFTVSDIRGLTSAQVQELGAAALNGVTGGTGVPSALIERLRGAGAALSATNAIDPSLRLPSQWRVAGSVNYEADFGALGDDWNFGANVVWSRVKDAWTWTDLRSVPNGKLLPDGRSQYKAFVTGSNNQDLLIYNTDRGYSWNIVGSFDKRFDFGLDLSGSYTWQRVRDVSSATSSTASSNFGNAAAMDPNISAYGISNYQRDNAWRLGAGYQTKLFGDNVSRVDLFMNSTSGQRYSYTFQDSTSGRSSVFGTTGANNRYLVYVPDVSSQTADMRVQYATTKDYEAMRELVLNSDLKKYQGTIAPKNIGRSPRWNKLDLRISQEVPFFLNGKVQLFADFENVLNMLNKNWGSLRQVSFPYYATVANVALNADGSKYIYSNVKNPTLTNSSTISIWQVRLGARLSFYGL